MRKGHFVAKKKTGIMGTFFSIIGTFLENCLKGEIKSIIDSSLFVTRVKFGLSRAKWMREGFVAGAGAVCVYSRVARVNNLVLRMRIDSAPYR